MEWLEIIMQIITESGVPVGLLIASLIFANKEREAHRQEMKEEREAHKEEIAALRDSFARSTSEMITAINNNTLVMQSIREKLG